MGDIGSILREAREARGLSVEEVEAQTRIRARYLYALEDEQFKILGGDVYVRGFLRNYASFLGLESEPLLAALPDTPPGEAVLPSALEPRDPEYLSNPLRGSSLPFGRILRLLVAAALITALFYFIWWNPVPLGRFLPRTGLANPSPTLTTGATGAVVVVTRPGTTQVTTQTIVIAPYSSPTVPASSLATAVPTATLPPRTPTPDLNATEPPTPAPVQSDGGVVVRAEILADTWVRVLIDQQDAPVVERVLVPGEAFEWIGEERITLRVGNAAGISITLNGSPVGPLGAAGEVREVSWVRNPAGGPPLVDESQG